MGISEKYINVIKILIEEDKLENISLFGKIEIMDELVEHKLVDRVKKLLKKKK